MILIRRLPRDQRVTEGGITIPDSAQLTLFKGKVLALGDGIETGTGLREFNLSVGDVVLIHDDPPTTDPRFRGASRHLIPVSADGDQFLVNESYIYAAEETNLPAAEA